jgi:asparagine synthase (glutamine-hydrolysing)
MCGIAGFYSPNLASPELAKAMGDRMAYRGPDDHGEWVQDGLHLSHRRLSIVDLSQGHQPMELPQKELVVVFNGEIFNHLELRKTYFGEVPFQTHCDTEVLLHGYKRWGKDLPRHLNGMFAFCIADVRNNKLFLARDRLGQKPLYYVKQGQQFAFASEIGPLLELPWVDRTLDTGALAQYFAHEHIPCPQTPFRNIFKLPPGHSMEVDLKTLDLKISRWWKASFVVDAQYEDERVAQEAFFHHWDRALRYRMMSDVPLGVFLSGGLDSSSCLAQLTHLFPEQKLKSFSVGFENPSFDESEYARLVAKHCGSEHYETTLHPQALLDVLPHIESNMLDPLADGSIIPTYLLCQHARKNVTVAIGGDAADELLCGYPTFDAHRMFGDTAWPRWLVNLMGGVAGLLPTNMDNLSLDFKIKQTLKGLPYKNPIRNEVWLGAGDPRFLARLFQKGSVDLSEQSIYGADLKLWKESDAPSLIPKIQDLYLGGYMNDGILTKVDRASMLNSLEVRSPFLDFNMVEFLNALPLKYKLQGKLGKIILRNTMGPKLPSVITARPKKGFGMPIAHWFRAELKDMLYERIQAAPEIFNREFLMQLFNEHQQGKADHRKPLFSYFMLHSVLKVGRFS